ncbi:MAG: shikimate kinase [Candidatus Dormibacteria bacterium]
MGAMGSGKSSIAGVLAERLSYPMVDNDAALALRLGMSTSAYSSAHGIEKLHREEKAMFFSVCKGYQPKIVCAPGSSAEWLTPETFPGNAVGVWLDVSPDVLWERINRGSANRPRELLAKREEFCSETRERMVKYRACARIVLHGNFPTPTLPGLLLASFLM